MQIICTIYLHTQGALQVLNTYTAPILGQKWGGGGMRMTSHEWTDHTGWLLKFDNRGFECCPVTTATHTCKPILQAQQLKLHQQTN